MCRLRFHHWFSRGVSCNSCANTFGILEILQNFVGPSNSRSHRIQRNFVEFMEAFRLHASPLDDELSQKWFAERNKEKKRPDGNHGAKRLILLRSLPAFPRYFDFCHFLICPMGHAQHLRRVHISRDKWLSSNNSGYRQIYTAQTRRSGISRTFCEHRRSRRAEGETGSLLWAQPLACRYYTTSWISYGNGATLFATNRCSPRFSD